jgi:hypothetical protein
VLSCYPSVHVATGDGDRHIAIPHAVSLSRLREIVAATEAIEPTAQVKSVSFGVVDDGTRWSEQRFGYEVTYSEAASSEGEQRSLTFIRQCDAVGCRWAQRIDPDLSGVEFGQKEGCRNVSRTDDSYRRVEARTRALIDAAPARIVEDRVQVARYGPPERFEDWRKEVEVQCAVEGDVSEAARCNAVGLAIRAGGADTFTMAPGIPLPLAIELRVLVTRRVPSAQVIDVSYSEVRDGGSWSAGSQGYSVAAAGGLKFSAGAYYEVVERCVSDSCGLHFVETDVRKTWVY